MLKAKQLWFYIEEVPKTSLFIPGCCHWVFTQLFYKIGAGNFINHFIGECKNNTYYMAFIRSEFNTAAEFIANKMERKPEWAVKLHQQVINNSKFLFKNAGRISLINLKGLSNSKLLSLYYWLMKPFVRQWSFAQATSWLADADKERFTNQILAKIKKQIKDKGLHLNPSKIFSILTTPLKQSYTEQEERKFLEIAKKIKTEQSLIKLFKKGKLNSLANKIKFANPDLYRRMYKHYQRFCWLSYMYEGPAYNFEYFLSRWQSIIRQNSLPKITILLKESEDKKLKIKKEQEKILKQLKPTQRLKKLIKFAQEMIWFKGYRKDCVYYTLYCLEPLLSEIARRLNISLKQLRQLLPWEIAKILKKGKVNRKELNNRMKHCIYYTTRKKVKIISGDKAKEFIKGLDFEQKANKEIKELPGSCACPGKVKGVVKVIMVPEDMPKMRKNEILVSHATNPNLVPAMKKAAAIITNTGGLTCHAAIVSREMNTPCVIGTRIATKVLKDGDRVEVDATKGVVRKL